MTIEPFIDVEDVKNEDKYDFDPCSGDCFVDFA